MKRIEVITKRGAKFKMEALDTWSVEMILWSLGLDFDDFDTIIDLDKEGK